MTSDIQAEQAVLGYAIANTDESHFLSTRRLTVDHFTEERRDVFKAIIELYQQDEFTVDTLVHSLRDSDISRSDIRDLAVEGSLEERSLTYYLDQVQLAYDVRTGEEELSDTLHEIQTGSLDNGWASVESLTEDLLAMQARSTGATIQTSGEFEAYGLDLYEAIEEGTHVVREPTGYVSFDNRFDGFPRGQLTTIVARPSHGKTTLALDICKRAGMRLSKSKDDEGQSLFFSLESPPSEIVPRLAANIAQIDTRKIQNGELTDDEFRRYQRSLRTIDDKVPITIDYTPDPTGQYIYSQCVAQHARKPVRIVVIDYLEEIEGLSKEQYDLSLAKAIRNLRLIAAKLNCVVILLAQMNRKIDGRSIDWEGNDIPAPQLSDIRYTGFAEQASKMVCAGYHPWTHYRQLGNRESIHEPAPERFFLYCLKNSNGRIGRIGLKFISNQTRFEDPQEPDEIPF